MTQTTDNIVPKDNVLDRPVTYVPFMSKKEVVLTAGMVLQFIAKPTKSGKTATVAQAIRFMKLCESRGLDPWEGDAFLVGYDMDGGAEFNLITAHQAFLKRAELHPEFDGMQSGVVVRLKDASVVDQEGDFCNDDQVLVGGWAKVHFKNRSIPTYRRAKLSTFSTGRSRWNKDAAGMIVKVAEADALRSSFPTSLGGLYLREEFDANEGRIEKPVVAMPKALPHPGDASLTIDPSTGNLPPDEHGNADDIGGDNNSDGNPVVVVSEDAQTTGLPSPYAAWKDKIFQITRLGGGNQQQFDTAIKKWEKVCTKENDVPTEKSRMELENVIQEKEGFFAYLRK